MTQVYLSALSPVPGIRGQALKGGKKNMVGFLDSCFQIFARPSPKRE
jgi:hypothetical protein